LYQLRALRASLDLPSCRYGSVTSSDEAEQRKHQADQQEHVDAVSDTIDTNYAK
jgi:hypothetical protein